MKSVILSEPVVAVLVAPDEAQPPGLEPLADEADVRLVREKDELTQALDAARVLAVYDFRTPLVRDLGDRVGKLEWIHAASAGVDAVLTPAVVASSCQVTNARGVFDRPIAEYCMAALLAFVKDLPRTLSLQRAREWRHRETRSLAGRHLLVVGAGSIGGEVGRLGHALGMEVRGISRRARDGHPVFGHLHSAADLGTHLGWADDVVVCAPLTEETRGLLDRAAFAALRPGANIVNVGRGPVVSEDALLEALRNGTVSGAALDVFESEPLRPDHPFWDMEQVIVSPHMSGDEEGWREALGRQFIENFRRWRRGEPLQHLIDKQAAGDGARLQDQPSGKDTDRP